MLSHGATPFFPLFLKEQLTVIMLAKKSVALRHWAVGEYFSAPFKALNALGKHRTAARRNFAFRSICFPEM